MALLSGRAVGCPRSTAGGHCRGCDGHGGAGIVAADDGGDLGQIRRCSMKTRLAEGAGRSGQILPKTAYYPGAIEDDLMGLFMARHQLMRAGVFGIGVERRSSVAMMAFGKHGKVIHPR